MTADRGEGSEPTRGWKSRTLSPIQTCHMHTYVYNTHTRYSCVRAYIMAVWTTRRPPSYNENHAETPRRHAMPRAEGRACVKTGNGQNKRWGHTHGYTKNQSSALVRRFLMGVSNPSSWTSPPRRPSNQHSYHNTVIMPRKGKWRVYNSRDWRTTAHY